MFYLNKKLKLFVCLVIFLFAFSSVSAQKKESKQPPQGKPVMWESVNVSERNLFYGPGGKEMQPDLSKITFIKEEKKGYNIKYRIKDGSGRVWVAKITREPQSETAAVRLVWALGYKTEINYLVKTITIPGKGTFENVRLEARPDDIKRLDEWKWRDNPFVGTEEFQGLKMMMVFLNNWDVYDLQNKVLQVDGENGRELHYIVSDLGATLGRLGNNNFPVIYRLGRSIGDAKDYIDSKFIKEIEGKEIKLAYKGKNRDLFKDITVEDGRWLARLLAQLKDEQIRDAFRAANYSENDITLFTQAVRNRIGELIRAVGENNLAEK